MGGDDNISPIAVISDVGVRGVGDLKSNAKLGLIAASDKRGWKVGLTGFLAGWNR